MYHPLLEAPYWNPHPLFASAPYRPIQIGQMPSGCPNRPWWWLVAAAGAGAFVGYAYQKNKGSRRVRP